MASRDRKPGLVICLALATLTAACYWPVTGSQFISIDDQQYITQNPHVTGGLAWPAIIWAFKSGYACNWHPLTWISHMADCQLFGLKPGGHHFTNLLLHTADSVLVFLWLHSATRRLWPAAIAAALFGLHPLHVESVAWASERKDVLSTFFFLLTLLAYTRYVHDSGSRTENAPRSRTAGRWYGLTLLLFALGLMSKPMVVTLPFVLLLLDYWPYQRLSVGSDGQGVTPSEAPRAPFGLKVLLLEKVPFFALTIAASIVTFLVQRTGGATVSLRTIPLGLRVSNAVQSYGGYFLKTLCPLKLSVLYAFPGHINPGVLAASCGLLALATFLVMRRAVSHPPLLVGWLWFLGTLVPVIGLVQVGAQAMADRYMYIPSIGLFIALVWGIEAALNSAGTRRGLLIGMTTAVLAVSFILTRRQLSFWHDSLALCGHAVDLMPDNYMALDGYGKALEDTGQKEQALKFYRASVALDPAYPQGQYNLGTLLMDMGQFDEAISHFQIAVHESPGMSDAWNNLGTALFRSGHLPEARAQFEKALALNPADAEAHYNLGTVLLAGSDFPAAGAQFRAATSLKHEYTDAWSSLGVALVRQGHSSDAVAAFAQAARLSPNNASAFFNLGLALADSGQFAKAAEQFQAVLKLKPDDAAAHYRLAASLARQQKTVDAVPQYRDALRLRPDFPDALNELALILCTDPQDTLRNGAEALKLAQEACRQTQNRDPEMLSTLAAAYAETGDFDKATGTARTALELAKAGTKPELASRIERWLQSFEQKRPIREP